MCDYLAAINPSITQPFPYKISMQLIKAGLDFPTDTQAPAGKKILEIVGKELSKGNKPLVVLSKD